MYALQVKDMHVNAIQKLNVVSRRYLCELVSDHAHGVKLAVWQEETHEPKVQERSMPVLTSALKMTSTSAGVLPLFLR